ncbi:MAG: hypothetical protein QXK65_02715, partial [Candidatus Micrarchaeaceae archaeon]
FIKAGLKNIKDTHWFFDSEMLVLAQNDHVKILEMPVEWKEQKDTKVQSSDPLYFLKSIMRLRRELRTRGRKPYT